MRKINIPRAYQIPSSIFFFVFRQKPAQTTGARRDANVQWWRGPIIWYLSVLLFKWKTEKNDESPVGMQKRKCVPLGVPCGFRDLGRGNTGQISWSQKCFAVVLRVHRWRMGNILKVLYFLTFSSFITFQERLWKIVGFFSVLFAYCRGFCFFAIFY